MQECPSGTSDLCTVHWRQRLALSHPLPTVPTPLSTHTAPPPYPGACLGLAPARPQPKVAEQQARAAEKSGSEFMRLLADATRHMAEERYRPAEMAFRKAIALVKRSGFLPR